MRNGHSFCRKERGGGHETGRQGRVKGQPPGTIAAGTPEEFDIQPLHPDFVLETLRLSPLAKHAKDMVPTKALVTGRA